LQAEKEEKEEKEKEGGAAEKEKEEDGKNKPRSESVQNMIMAVVEAMWKASILDIERTLRAACEKIASDKGASDALTKRRLQGMLVIGK
jgi:hypothetical protein